ncbi:MAG: LLM class flavin-dependent oxidoreductase [Deltaproteobacteria bacterium]|nr:LLM class flavin-dependent oxidoreductase [Deltaproteobacteria bacterium]
MKLGMTLPTMVPEAGRDALLGWSRAVDAGPFSSLAVGERISFGNAEALVSLSAAAAVTERVRIVATCFVLPLHTAPWLAKQAASLDRLAAGRFTMAVGVGGREEDYRVVGAPFERRHARMDEQVAELRRIWSGEPALPDSAPVGPPPHQHGGPPLWIAAAGERPLRRAARWAEGLAGFSLGPGAEEMDRVFRSAEQAWRDAGREKPPHLATSFWYALGDDAASRLAEYAARYLDVFGEGPARALASQCRAAGQAALRESLTLARDAGADEVILVPTSADPDELERTLDAIAPFV